MAGPPGSIFYSSNMSIPEGAQDPMAYLRTPVVQAFGITPHPLIAGWASRTGFAPHDVHCSAFERENCFSAWTLVNPVVVCLRADWIGLIAIGWCTATLAVKLVYFKPPANTEVQKG